MVYLDFISLFVSFQLIQCVDLGYFKVTCLHGPAVTVRRFNGAYLLDLKMLYPH